MLKPFVFVALLCNFLFRNIFVYLSEHRLGRVHLSVALLCVTPWLGLAPRFLLWLNVVYELYVWQNNHRRVNVLLRRARKFCRKNAYKISRSRATGYCWVRPCVGAPLYLVLAIGPRITRSTFRLVYWRYGDVFKSGCWRAVNNHISFSTSRLHDRSAWFAGGVQEVIDIAQSVNASSLGISEASTQFKEALKTIIRVDTDLTPMQRKEVERELDFNVVFRGKSAMTNDHPVVCALREIVRTIHERLARPAQSVLRTLVVGSGAREVKNYGSNPFVHYYFHMSESKDYGRVLEPFLGNIVESLRKRIGKKRKKHGQAGLEQLSLFKRYKDAQAVMEDYRKLNKLPPNMHTRLEGKYERLIFEDSHYNFKRADYGHIFRKTGANVAYGYGLMPLEMLFPDIPESKIYKLRKFGEKYELVFRNGYCNGYSHDVSAWETLFKNPVMNFSDFSLVVEITSMVGPFALFSITRVANDSNPVVRTFELPEKKKYVRVLDMFDSVGSDKQIRSVKRYFSVFASEYFETLNYALAIDAKSLSFPNILTFCRRRSGGVSLVTKELLGAWNMLARDMPAFAYAVNLQAKLISRNAAAIEQAGVHTQTIGACKEKIVDAATQALKFLGPASEMSEWVRDVVLKNRLVLFPQQSYDQRSYVQYKADDVEKFSAEIEFRPDDEEINPCFICAKLEGHLDLQIMDCSCKKTKPITFEMTTEEVTGLNLELACNDLEPAGLVRVFERCRQDMPKVGFSHNVRLHYIKGGPGCGKSYVIRKLASEADLIYAPFTKLMSDYKAVPDPVTGQARDLPFQTTHRGVSTRGANMLFVDEFTSLPFEYLKMVAYQNAVEDVFIVGDHKQTRVREPEEGMYIGNHVDLDELSVHTLMRNFRNPIDAVLLLNDIYGYDMQPMSAVEKSFYVLGPDDPLPELASAVYMAYTRNACRNNNLTESCTVRTNQGATHENVVLYVTADDRDLLTNDSMNIVALSRHKNACYIKHDGSEAALSWLAKHAFDEARENKVVHTRALAEDEMTTDRLEASDMLASFSSRSAATAPLAAKSNAEDVLEVFRENRSTLLSGFKTLLLCAFSYIGFMVYCQVFSVVSLFSGFSVTIPFISAGFVPFYSSQFWEQFVVSSKDFFFARFSAFSAHLGKDIVFVRFLDCLKMWFFAAWQSFKSWRLKAFYHNVLRTAAASGAYMSQDDVHIKPLVNAAAVDDGWMNLHFSDYVHNLVPFARQYLTSLPDVPVPEVVRGFVQTGRDAYALLDTFLPPAAVQETGCTSYNQLGSAFASADLRTGTIAPVDFLCPLNARRNPMNLLKKYYQFCPGSGLQFSAKSPAQLLQVMGARYFNKKGSAPVQFGHEAQQVAKSVVDLFFKEHMEAKGFDFAEADVIFSEFVKSCRVKHYQQQFVGFDNADTRVVRFHLKDIYKPKTSGFADPFKAGQGISAWNKDVQSMFGGVARIVNKQFLDCLKEHTIYDNRLTPVEMKERVSHNLSKLPVAMSGVTDFTMFDSQQDQFTQEIERQFLLALGCSEEFVHFYYSFRSNYTILGGALKGRCKFEKTSGEPFTLMMNTVLSACLTNTLLRGEGPMMMAVKGDDGFKRQANLAIDRDAYDMLSKYTNLKIKLTLADEAEFCGYAVCDGNFVDSVYRKLHKLASHRFRDYKHFTEYQASLRDFVRDFERDGNEVFSLACNASLYGTSYEEALAAYECLKSFAHVDEIGFQKTFVYRVDAPVFPKADGTVLLLN